MKNFARWRILAKQSNQKLKIIYVLDILKRYSDEDNPLNSAQIADRLKGMGIQAERKSIYDDISQLQLYGCDIIKSSGVKKGWFVGDREFEVPEIYLLSDAVRTAKFISAKKTRELLSKLSGMLSVNQAKRREKGVFFGTTEKSGNEGIYYNIDKISRAIENREQIRVEYSSRQFDENRTVRRISKEMYINPYALCWQDDHYYLIGNHSKYDNLIHLRLDRMDSVELTGRPARHFSCVSDYRDFFDTADYTYKLFGMHSGELMETELVCSRRITEQVLDRFGQDIFITNVTDREFTFRIKAAVSEALVTWIINYGGDLRVKKPQQLKDMVTQRAKAVLKNYTDGEENENA